MREKIKAQTGFGFQIPSEKNPKRKTYDVIDKTLQDNPEIEVLVREDLVRGLKNPNTGRKGLSASQVIRFVIAKQIEQVSYRKLYYMIADSFALRNFCKISDGKVPCFTAINTSIKRLSPQTLEKINKILVLYAKKRGIEKGRAIRVDNTAVETNIHNPTDNSLIWDCVRVATRLAAAARELVLGKEYYFPNRTRVVKKLNFRIINTKGKDADKKRKIAFKELICYGREVIFETRKLQEVLKLHKPTSFEQDVAQKAILSELDDFIGWFENVLLQTEERILYERKVHADDKVFSIFETHTDIIVKGSRDPVFGHKVCLVGGKSNLILDCIIQQGNPHDSTIFEDVIDRQIDIYQRAPLKTTADGGFYQDDNAKYAQAKGVRDVVFSKGPKNKLTKYVKSTWVYKKLRNFRAGIEAIISWSKRCFGLDRCNWKSWESFQSYIWSSIIAFNVMLLAKKMLPAKNLT